MPWADAQPLSHPGVPPTLISNGITTEGWSPCPCAEGPGQGASSQSPHPAHVTPCANRVNCVWRGKCRVHACFATFFLLCCERLRIWHRLQAQMSNGHAQPSPAVLCSHMRVPPELDEGSEGEGHTLALEALCPRSFPLARLGVSGSVCGATLGVHMGLPRPGRHPGPRAPARAAPGTASLGPVLTPAGGSVVRAMWQRRGRWAVRMGRSGRAHVGLRLWGRPGPACRRRHLSGGADGGPPRASVGAR